MLQIDAYANLNSPLHRLEPKLKLIALFVLMMLFAMVRDLRLVPFMLLASAIIYAVSRLPLPFLIKRLKYPGVFVLAMVIFLPLFAGQTVLYSFGPLSIKQEGIEQMILLVSRFISILTVAVVLFGTSSLLNTLKAMTQLGIPQTLADLTLLTFRYVYELGDMLQKMQRAMKLRGFRPTKFNKHTLTGVGSLLASLIIRSYETSERVYYAMRLRGYGQNKTQEEVSVNTDTAITKLASGAAVSVNNLSFGYSPEKTILKDLNLSIKAGERVGLIGPNGTGKSSLFMLLCGILAPKQGNIKIFDQDLVSNKFRSDIGFIFQNAADQLFSLTVKDDIAFGPQNLNLSPEEVEQRVSEAMRLTNTTDLAEQAPHHLSGGQRRMVAIATTLAMQPKLVLYDEPAANLDMRSRRRLITFLQNADHTLILASHDLELILEVCDRVILLDEGGVIADGKAESVMADEALMEAHGLEKPHSLEPHVHIHQAAI